MKVAELTEVMRQRGSETLINLLNNIKTGAIARNYWRNYKRFRDVTDPDYRDKTFHIWTDNAPV